METRQLGRTGRSVGVVGFGAWQIGGSWGDIGDDAAMDTLNAAIDAGVSFIDTADVYGDGRSERFVGELLRTRPDAGIMVATKMGRRADPHTADAYSLDAFRSWNDRSRENLGVDTLDLVQLHCPPPDVYAREAVFDALDTMVQEKRVRAYGVSVETCDEALAAIRRPGVATIQIILNCFRQKPLDVVLPAAREAGVGIIARVPLASGLLSGKYDESTRFADDDHRTFNRHGESFDVGETFAGVPFEVGVVAAREIAELTPGEASTAQLALRWILDQPGVSVVIPGARSPEQARANAAAAELSALDTDAAKAIRRRIGYMPENDSFVGEMTAVTFLRQMAELSGLPPKAALEKAQGEEDAVAGDEVHRRHHSVDLDDPEGVEVDPLGRVGQLRHRDHGGDRGVLEQRDVGIG
jgi:aryl-alcohol dehydrogenase-like predicted oxidoreductase